MKNIKKLLFTILIVFITIVTVKAEAIKQIDVYLSYLPDANERAEFFYMSTNLLEYNRDKVGMDLELFDGDNYVDWDDELEAGKTYKIMLYFETNSVNDWIDDNTVVKVHALNGTNLPNTTQVFENEWVYTYEFEYTIPTTSMAKNIITFYEDGTSSSTSQLYVNNGVTITVPDRFYSEPEGYVFDGFLYNDHKYNAGDEFTVTEDATFVAQFVPVTTTPKTYKIKYYVDGELKHEVDAPEGTELWEYASPDEVFDNIPAGKSMNYEDTWYRDSEFKELETFVNKDHSPILVNKDDNFYAYYGYYYDVEARIINYSSYSYFENLKLTSTEEPNGYPGLYAFVPLSNHTTTLGYIYCDGLEFVGWSTSANQSDIVSTEKTYVFDVDSNGKQMYALFSKKDDAHYVYFEDHEELTQFVSDGNKATAPTGLYAFQKEVEGWYLDSGLTDKFDFIC